MAQVLIGPGNCPPSRAQVCGAMAAAPCAYKYRMADKPFVLRFPPEDGLLRVSRATLRDMAARLRLSEPETVQLAMARLRDELMPPRYAPDDGEVPPEMLAFLRRTEPQDDYRPTRSLLAGL